MAGRVGGLGLGLGWGLVVTVTAVRGAGGGRGGEENAVRLSCVTVRRGQIMNIIYYVVPQWVD